MISIRKNYTVPTFVRIGVSILSASALASCGGGGGDAGTTNASAIANRYNVSLVTRPATSVFYGGSNTTALCDVDQDLCDRINYIDDIDDIDHIERMWKYAA